MRCVDRSAVAPPDYLFSAEVGQSRRAFLEFLRLPAKERAQTRVPDRHVYDNRTIQSALERLFLKKCAFCEGRVSTSVYRFRPPSDAEPTRSDPMAHLAYGWLADAWQNLYPICRDCRPARLSYFPVRSRRLPAPSPEVYAAYAKANDGIWHGYPLREKALLLDPCQNRAIGQHMAPSMDGYLSALSWEGKETIVHFKLNRSDLVTRRKRVFAVFGKAEAAGGPPPGPEAEFVGLWTILRQARSQEAGGSAPLARASPADPPELDDQAVPAAASAPPPRLVRIELENFKALESLRVDFPADHAQDGLARALLILGENAAGKSSILEATALALLDDEARALLGETPRRLLLDPRFLGADTKRQRGRGSVRLAFDDGSERILRITQEGFATEGAPPRQPVFAYGAFRHYLEVKRRWSPERPVISLFRSDNLLSNPESWLLGLSERHFDMVVQALREIFGAAQTFNIIERDSGRRSCFVVWQIDGERRGRTPLSSVSSGFRTILALTCDVMRWTMDRRLNPGFQTLVSAPGIVLIDEVEAHLHPRWKIQIMRGLRRALPGMSFIATTHDPLCLRGMSDGEVKVLHRAPGQAAGSELPVMIETLSNLPNVSRLTVEQLLTSDLFSLFSTDDPETELKLARLADFLTANRPDGAAHAPGRAVWNELGREVAMALPVGHGEAARLIQEAVAQYLVQRRGLPAEPRATLRADTRQRILRALEPL